jgi:hypothetical protein
MTATIEESIRNAVSSHGPSPCLLRHIHIYRPQHHCSPRQVSGLHTNNRLDSPPQSRSSAVYYTSRSLPAVQGTSECHEASFLGPTSNIQHIHPVIPPFHQFVSSIHEARKRRKKEKKTKAKTNPHHNHVVVDQTGTRPSAHRSGAGSSRSQAIHLREGVVMVRGSTEPYRLRRSRQEIRRRG